jgi:hypothetical protein
VESRLFPTSAVLVTEEWKKLNRNERIFLTGGRYDKQHGQWVTPGAPNRLNFLPFQFAVTYPAAQCAPGLHVHYVFDLNKQFKRHALDLFQLMKKDPKLRCRHRLGGIDFEIGEKAPGLQAADMLAYQVYKFSKFRIGRDKPAQLSDGTELFRQLIKNRRQEEFFLFLDHEGLNVALHNMPPAMRSEGWHPVTLKP